MIQFSFELLSQSSFQAILRFWFLVWSIQALAPTLEFRKDQMLATSACVGQNQICSPV